MPMVPVESTVCVWVKVRVWCSEREQVASVIEQGKYTYTLEI